MEADSGGILGFAAFGVGAGEILPIVQIAMTAGWPYSARRDAVLTRPTLVEGLIPLFSSAVSTHKVVESRRAQTSAA
jgi:pyruvate/2-oxoglutarate dehydrogenase complex dihydrolipoamide dehydrogenase (E3) component